MRIKRIEIIGFKSFCDRTVLAFSAPVIGIVGPNGGGKSNIVDAIRWCMGERSAKHLRGQAMVDVIFAGSDSRERAGMAEVSLTFEDVGFSTETLRSALKDESAFGDSSLAEAGDGDDAEERAEVTAAPARRPLPIDYSRFSEVTITRRLFRDGTSQYLLNKAVCRLRDITDFFLGTGIGTKALSIIEQDRIGMIVSARASERRRIIEETAGITKFEAKKRAAERKLEQTRENLLRVSDIVEERSKRLGALRRQAQKAERYRRYRAEVKDTELHIAAHKLLALIAEDKRDRAAQRELADKLAVARAELEAIEAKVVAERAELAVEGRRLSELQERIYALDNESKLTESKVEFQRREAAELEERAASAHGEIRALADRRAETDEEAAHHRLGLGALQSELGGLQTTLDERDVAFAAARVALARAKTDLDSSRTELSEARSDKIRTESRRETLARRTEDARRRLARVLAETDEHDRRVAASSRDATRLDRALAELEKQRLLLAVKTESMERRQEELEEATVGGEAAIEVRRDELHRQRSRLQWLREIHDRFEGYALGTRAVMRRRGALAEEGPEGEIRDLVAEVVNVPPRLEVAIESVLGDRIGGVVVSSPDVGARAIDYLKESGGGRSTFVAVAEAMPPLAVEDRSGQPAAGAGVLGRAIDLVAIAPGYESVARDLLDGAVIVEDLGCAYALRARGARGTMVTLEGDVLDDRGVISGGSREAGGLGVLAQRREIRELEEICRSLESDLAAATARFVAHKSELTRVSRTLDSLRKESHDCELAITAHEKDLAAARAALDRLRGQLTRLDAEQLELEVTIGACARGRTEIDEAERDADSRIARHGAAAAQVSAAMGALRAEVEARSHAVTEAKVRIAQLGEKRSSAKASALRLDNVRRELAERVERLEPSISAGTERAAVLRSAADQLETGLGELAGERRAGALELKGGRSAYEARVAEIAEAELVARERRQQAEELSAEVTALEMKLTNLAANRQNVEARVSERYRLSLPRILGDYHLRPEISPEDHERLAQRRRLIERMGSDINLAALAESAEISERHEFLSAQRADLDNAVDQLERAIAKTDQVSRRLFLDTFNAINERFAATFARLFSGGLASLALTGGDDVDVLEAGIEIMAQPPGKKNTTVDQLSGGEKALTAVALLFAIFLVKPSPFCLLDEVDAPLDDANVDRYNAMLLEMTDRTQFICITHNKRTVEIADRLYGVTMPEPGVSKLVPVNLCKIGGNGDGPA